MLVESTIIVFLASVKVRAIFPSAITALTVVAALETYSFPGLLTRSLKTPGREMSMVSDTTWVGKKPLRRIGGMSDALSIAVDLGFSLHPPPSQEEVQNRSCTTGEDGDDLIKVLRDLNVVQIKIADLQVELQGRKDDKNVAHLTHVSEMEKKCETLARITTILKDVIQNKDRIIARLQQPYSLDCIPVEAEYQKQFSELLMKAASDYGVLTASVTDFQWSENFKESPSVWGVGLKTRYGDAPSNSGCFSIMHPILRGHVCNERIFCNTSKSKSGPFCVLFADDSTNQGFLSRITRRLNAWLHLLGKTNQVSITYPSRALEANILSVKKWRMKIARWGHFHPVDGGSHSLRRLSWSPSIKKNGL
ncbi:hypothetical protein DITRI_Ditri13aG0142200 [Diplodiscus trichospermus]